MKAAVIKQKSLALSLCKCQVLLSRGLIFLSNCMTKNCILIVQVCLYCQNVRHSDSTGKPRFAPRFNSETKIGVKWTQRMNDITLEEFFFSMRQFLSSGNSFSHLATKINPTITYSSISFCAQQPENSTEERGEKIQTQIWFGYLLDRPCVLTLLRFLFAKVGNCHGDLQSIYGCTE